MKYLSSVLWGIAALTLVLLAAPVPLAQVVTPPTTFLETFDSDAGSPIQYRPPGWDVTTVAHANETIENMWADHGPNCEAPDDRWPGGQPSSTANHFIHLASETTFNCRDHIMTAMNAGYGAVYLTPPALADFRNGTATIEWDMSTQRTSSRDWVDIMILPFSPERADLEPPMASNMVDFHTPRDGIQIELQGGGNVFAAHTFLPGPNSSCGPLTYSRGPIFYCGMRFDGYHTWDMIMATYGQQASAARRDHFIIEISKTHLRMGFRPAGAVGAPFRPYFYWIDTDIPGGPLRFDEGLVQFNQRVYNPLKPCGPGVGDPGASQTGWVGTCRANTWHWDSVSINPATPFTIMPGARKIPATGGTVTFPLPAPPNSFLKADGDRGAEYSINGTTWQRLPVVGPEGGAEVGDSFWAPIPAGTQTVYFRGAVVADIYLYTRTPRGAIPLPTPLPATATAVAQAAAPTPTGVPTSTPTVIPTATRTPVPTATVAPTATQTPVPTPTTSATVTPTPSAPLCEVLVRLDGTEAWLPKEGFCE